MKIRYFYINLENYILYKEMSIHFWNDYLLYTPSYYKSGDGEKKMYSFLMIFGFANGTDFEIDISPYLMDTEYYNEENNLYDFLMTKYY